MFDQPHLEDRDAQHYVAIRTQVTMQELGAVLPQLWGEVFAWLGQQGIAPSGAPLVRYLVIDMARQLDIAVGVPVAVASSGDERVIPGVLPAGRYATLVYTGIEHGIAANAALQTWAQDQGIAWRKEATEHGDRWEARVEFSLTDPADEPDPAKWQTEVAYLIAD